MAETTTTKSAVWNPPRLRRIGAGNTESGSLTEQTYDGRWEGGGTTPSRQSTNVRYRMPTSGESITTPNPWQ